jgi:hypothetical protein
MKHHITRRKDNSAIKLIFMNKRGVSVVISTVIVTTTVMVSVLITAFCATNILNYTLAENDFAASKQFMLTTGLQIDDVAWTVGRTQTTTYSTKFGHVRVQTLALNYSMQTHSASGWETVLSNITTGMVLFNIPIDDYNIDNHYFERILPSQNGSFLQEGPAATVSHVFVHELLPINGEDFLRIAIVPSIRFLNSSIAGPSQSTSTSYCKFFLPTLERSSENQYVSQSVTMIGGEIKKIIRSGIDQVKITVSFPSGFDSTFFKFDSLVETKSLPADSVVEFYIGNVIVSLGLA